MTKPKYRKPLPKRFSAAMSEEAYAALRKRADALNLSNNYVLTAVFEYADALIDDEALKKAVADMLEKSRVE